MPDWTPCGLGVCAAESGHEGTCAEASGWDEPAECYFTADSTHGERFCHTHGEEHGADVEIRSAPASPTREENPK